MADATATPGKESNQHSVDFLIRGTDYLAQYPEFKLVDRKEDLKNAASVLMRKDNNRNLIIYGGIGAGTSSILMALQSGKSEGAVPLDIVGKRFYWLDTDALFSSGDPGLIRSNFSKAMETLTLMPDTVLVIDGIKDFMDGIRNHGTTNLLHTLMREIRTNNNLQVIIEGREDDMPELFKLHSDIRELFTLQQVKEPAGKELEAILNDKIVSIEKAHGIKIAADVVATLCDIAAKYPGIMADKAAQPKRSMMILEDAITDYLNEKHSRPKDISEKEDRLKAVKDMLGGNAIGKTYPEYQDKSPSELKNIAEKLTTEILDLDKNWKATKEAVNKIYEEQKKAEALVRQKEKEIADQALIDKKKQQEMQAKREQAKDTRSQEQARADFLEEKLNIGLSESSEIVEMKKQRDKFADNLARVTSQYKDVIAKLNQGLVLTSEHVLKKFSQMSGQSLEKKDDNASARLLNMNTRVKQRVFGQDEAVDGVTNYIKFGSLGMKLENKPLGNFLFVGPTGTGKTELVKALAEQLFGTEKAVTRFDMGGFQEKNTVSTLVGSPRGYEGYADGGALTNAVRTMPNSIVLFDEVEKAHKDVFDLLLPVFDEGVLADTQGRIATFGNVLNVMTSNVGADQFMRNDLITKEQADEVKDRIINKKLYDDVVAENMDEKTSVIASEIAYNAERIAGRDMHNRDKKIVNRIIRQAMSNASMSDAEQAELVDDAMSKLNYQRAKEEAIRKVYSQNKEAGGSGFRPEFLARVDDIFFFRSLEIPQIILIAKKELKYLANQLMKKEIKPEMSEEDIAAMCQDHNNKKIGGRGIRNYINSEIKSQIADQLLVNGMKPGTIRITYNKAAKRAETQFIPTTANTNKPSQKPAAGNG